MAHDVDALIDDLLAAHDPKTTDIVDVPRRAVRPRPRVGALPGGLRRPRARAPACSATSRRRLREAGAPPPKRMIFFGLSLAGPTDGHARQRRAAPAGRCGRCSPARRSGASCSPSPAPAPTSPGLATRAVQRRRRVGRQRPEGVEHARAPRRPGMLVARTDPDLPEAQGPDVLHGRHARARASRCGRCARSPVRPSSTRCTSPTCASPTPTASATSATAGGCR